MNPQLFKNIIEAALLTANAPLSLDRLQALFSAEDEAEARPNSDQIQQILDELRRDYAERGIELKQVSSGFRIQARQDMSAWLNQLTEDKPARYSRALLETLALVAYRQPITRAGVEDIRGVSVSSSIIKTLMEREWIRVVGHRDVPGRPALYGTSKEFLDYFNLESLGELPPLAEMRSIDDIQREFDLSFSRTEKDNHLEDNAEDDIEVNASSSSEADHASVEKDESVLAPVKDTTIDAEGDAVEVDSDDDAGSAAAVVVIEADENEEPDITEHEQAEAAASNQEDDDYNMDQSDVARDGPIDIIVDSEQSNEGEDGVVLIKTSMSVL